MFELTKPLHVSCVVLTALFFVGRGVMLLRDPLFIDKRWVRTTAAMIDTLLLLSGAMLSWLTDQMPWREPWLASKLGLLLFYIMLGMVAFHWGRTVKVRFSAWLLALALFAMIIRIAVGKGV